MQDCLSVNKDMEPEEIKCNQSIPLSDSLQCHFVRSVQQAPFPAAFRAFPASYLCLLYEILFLKTAQKIFRFRIKALKWTFPFLRRTDKIPIPPAVPLCAKFRTFLYINCHNNFFLFLPSYFSPPTLHYRSVFTQDKRSKIKNLFAKFPLPPELLAAASRSALKTLWVFLPPIPWCHFSTNRKRYYWFFRGES